MNLKALTEYCLSKPGAREDYPFGPDPLVMKVGSKMFALMSVWDDGREQISLKCDPILAESLREQHKSVIPGYHLNKTHWNTVFLDGTIPDEDILSMVDHSYELVIKSLKKAEREAIHAS
jgi:predicted DNA-binding protein (MmcQ/YjbR family)